ncbi:metal-dependent hydrolase [Sulfolobus acidocaldarius]|uniref:Conserved membrane protein n=4 Tax=Sulfolobus acidocaldarius TaxID=2285 RepID=Q4J9X0_SULAC|nr:metal-dependent hydrolase [Sulfolobus acidocaldarius]AAY80412.1 conserved membrane protein [Sulfolobus acidocaldarius DSM 639]AGE70995.1 hypothetical protein SacN8_05120 [Sulfolobus acidocaldarius N8]AGE73266.1 hypothetical protein SacRon12I_05110 [Sulfolobus acidocaldarius Ron12/I]ALU28706.1 hypothetical protein ATY89_01190 [Sulfolobus acidocaldarius]ALU31424.1 hypothetical protein ATZ20_04225 [Sulfolobus acidocaldarius]
MNLNSHILLALALGLALFHRVDLAVLVGIGAAIPDLDREYTLLKRDIFRRMQLHRALFHNIFFIIALFLFNKYIGIGALTHVIFDAFTSPSDRGVELFFPLTRLIKEYKLNYEGKESGRGRRPAWYLEDPTRLVERTADKDLREPKKEPWRRIYGPFKNSMLVDWAVFYASGIYIILNEQLTIGFLNWLIQFLYVVFVKYIIISIGIVMFYAAGEVWRRRNVGRRPIIVTMAIGFILILYQGSQLFSPLSIGSLEAVYLVIPSLAVGIILAYLHVKMRKKEVVL